MMNLFGATAKISAVAIFFVLVLFATIPQLGSAQAEDTPNVIGSRIWCDDNRDGILNNGEKIPNVTVNVTGESSGYSESRVSDANGNYKFTELPADNFTVQVVTSTLPSNCNQLISEGPDSRFVRFEGGGAVITKSVGPLDNMTTVYLDDVTHRFNTEQNFGYEPPPGIVPGTGSIGNYIWCDADLSGDATNNFTSTKNDLPVYVKEILDGVRVRLTNADGTTISTTTDEDGGYLFSELGVGPYTVSVDSTTLPLECNIPAFDSDGGTAHEAQVSIERGATGQGDEKLGVDFSYQPAEPLGAAIGTVWCDNDKDFTRDSGEGIPNVKVTMASADTDNVYRDITALGGRFVIMNLPAGEYELAVDAATLPESCGDTLADMRDSVGNPVTVTAVSGRVQELVNTGAELEIGFAGTLPVADLGGRIWCDVEPADGLYTDREELTGVQVTVTGAGGNKFTKATSVGGLYTFQSLVEGVYSVQVDPSTITGACKNPISDFDGRLDNMTVVTLTGEISQLDVNFVYNDDEIVVTPVVTATPVVTSTPVVTTTPVVTSTPVATETPEPTIEPTVEPTPEPTIEPTAEPTPVPTQKPTEEPTSVPTPEPTAAPTDVPAAITGTIWDDTNGNGAKDEDETGLAGVSVALYDSSGMIISSLNTDNEGAYEIRVNEPGDYYITIVVPENSAITGSNNDIDTTTGRSEVFTIAAGETKIVSALGIDSSPEGTGTQACPDGLCLYFLPSIQ